jgi:maleate cis-trans isomerase
MATEKLEQNKLVIDGIELNQDIIVGMLGNESKVLQLLLNENNQFKPETLLKIAKTYPALGLIIIKNTHLRSKMSSKQLIELACPAKNHALDLVIAEELFGNYNEYGITLLELKDLALTLARIYFYSISITPIFFKSILALIEEHEKSSFFQNDELLNLVACASVSTALCQGSEKYKQLILNLTSTQLVKLLSAYKAHTSQTHYHELMTMPVLREALEHLDAASFMEWFMKSKGADIQQLSRFIFEDEALIAKITGAQVIPFLTKLGTQPAESVFFQKCQHLLVSLPIQEIHSADFYGYSLLATTYAPQDLKAKLKEIAIRIKKEDAIRFIPVEEIIKLATMNSHLNKAICAAIVRMDQYKDDQGVLQYTFNLKQLDRIIEVLSASASPESQSLLIQYMKGKMNSKFVDANLGSKSYVHAVATIDAFLEHNPTPGPTARLVISNLCQKNPLIREYIKEHSPNNYLRLEGIFTAAQKSTQGLEKPKKPHQSTDNMEKPVKPHQPDDQEEQQRCSIM